MGRFVVAFVGSLDGLPTGKINPRGRSRGHSRGRSRGPTRGPTRGSNFAFACSVCRPAQEPNRNQNRAFLSKLYCSTEKPSSPEEPSEPKTGTARTVLCKNRNRPNRTVATLQFLVIMKYLAGHCIYNREILKEYGWCNRSCNLD